MAFEESMTGAGLNKSQLAQLIGKQTKVIDDWLKKGLPHTKNGGRYEFDLPAVFTWREDQLRDMAKAGPANSTSSKKKKEAMAMARDEAALRESKARAHKLEMENAVRERELAPIEEMENEWAEAVLGCRAKLLAMPPKYAPLFADEDRATVIQSEMEAAIYEALHELSGGADAGTGGEG